MFLLIIFSCLLRSRNASSAMPCHAKSIMLSRTHLVLDSFLMLIAFVYLYSYYAVRIDAQWTWAHHKMLHCEWQKIAACLDTLSTEQQPQRKIETNELLAVYTNWPNQRINFNHFQMASRWEGEKILSHFFSLMPQTHTHTDELCKITQRRCNRYSSGAVSPSFFSFLSIYIFSKWNSTHNANNCMHELVVCMQ